MIKKVITSALTVICFATTVFANPNLDKAKSAVRAKNEKQALDYYKEVLKTEGSNIEALIGASLMSARVGNREASNTIKKGYFGASKIYAQKALKVASTNADANYVMAVAMGRMALISSAKEKVAASRDIKKYADLAIKYNPNHGEAWHVLGRYNFGVATLNSIEKTAANSLFGGLPKGDLGTAAACFLKSIRLKPDYIYNYVELGKVYYEQGKKQDAINIWNKGASMPSVLQDDDANKAECRRLAARK